MHHFLILLTACFCLSGTLRAEKTIPEKNTLGIIFFEKKVRPLLEKHCLECHGSKKQFAELRLDSLHHMLKGGESGPAIVVNQPENSLLIEAVRRESFEMPPDQDLTEDEINILIRWIKSGAAWPTSANPQDDRNVVDFHKHWAFQPVRNPKIPEVQDKEWPANPIDHFILARLESNGLQPSPQAPSKTLLRRMTSDLTGLQVDWEQVEQFQTSSSPEIIKQEIDQLLASPHYGERWGRYWLDLARYADTKGYVFFEKQDFRVAYTYRGYVINSFNEDKPYNQFLREQLAADKIASEIPHESLAALGFIVIGPHLKNDEHNIIADRIDVVTRGLLGLTVGCARCHDHKYDPISAEDYYSLYGVFRNSISPLHLPFRMGEIVPAEHKEAADKVRKAAGDLNTHYLDQYNKVMQDAQTRLADYLTLAQANRSGPDTILFDVVVDGDDLNPQLLQLWQQFLSMSESENSPVMLPWHTLAKLHKEDFPQRSKKLLQQQKTQKTEKDPIANSFITSYLLEQELNSFNDVIKAYAELAIQTKQQRDALQTDNQQIEVSFPDDLKEEFYQTFFRSASPLKTAFHGFQVLKLFPDRKSQGPVKKLNSELDAARANLPIELAQMLVLQDAERMIESRVMKRGNPGKLAQVVPRRYLRFFKDVSNKPFQDGSGRLELADAIVSPNNPLTARVIVNRVWQHHFGQGIVTTPSDFGIQGSPPSHPELLDHLATWLVEHNWSIKSLHRYIMQSATYQQSSAYHEKYAQIDPENNLCWRMNRRRLDFESMRDGLLQVTNRLDLTIGGKSVRNVMAESNKRRTLYTHINRQDLPGVYRTFDFPPPDVSSGTRDNTTVPSQTLFMLNHPLVLSCSKELGESAQALKSNNEGIEHLYQTILHRNPSTQELNESLSFVKYEEENSLPPLKTIVPAWKYGVAAYNLESDQLTDFQKLPHWTGEQFQGGEKLPDPKLGWVFINSTGGHPGNDMDHVAVLRWVAPGNMTVSIKGILKHEKKQGSGIRARVLIAGQKKLGPWVLHENEAETNLNTVSIQKGEAIDFVVDVNDNLGYDSFIWSLDIVNLANKQDNSLAKHWNYAKDFRKPTPVQISPWQSLAQILLISNEFQFVD
ncbi:MAG: PSD1 domain-containing protein [Planctomycetaceae bacterium]|nr:PSD1 domain-containing protein [Planctomycetaceae bacterium]